MLVLPARAKINLALEVIGRRGDGWHDIDSVMVPIDWHDLVGLRLSRDDCRLRVTGRYAPEIDADTGDNLAIRAARAAIAECAGDSNSAGLEVWLDKRLPVGAGLGGGSADAAAVLRGASRLLSAAGADGSNALMMAAESIGSDVPALLHGGALRVAGRGERLTPLGVPTTWLAVVFVARSSTAAAYAALGDEDLGVSGRVDRLVAALKSGAPLDDAHLGSALEPAAFRATPTLAAGAQRLRASVPQARWHVTGSGGALFSVAPNHAAARELADAAQGAGFVARACRTVEGSTASGARR